MNTALMCLCFSVSSTAEMRHITVRKAADGRVVLSKCQKYQLYHCPFCQPSIFKPRDYASVSAHIESHRLKAVLHREFTIFICHLECRAAKHFHCPYCPKTYVNRSDFTKHIPQCESVRGRAPGATARAPDVTSATARGPDVTSATARGPDVTSATARGPDVTSATARGPDVTSAAVRCPDAASAAARGPDATSATARGPDAASATARGPDVTSATARGPDAASVTARAPDVTSATARGPDAASASARGPDAASASARGPDVTSATARGPDAASATARGPGAASATARGPGAASATARGPDVTSATVRGPDVTSATVRGPGSACPAVRPASKRKIKCRNCSLWLNKNNLTKHQLRKHTSAEKDITAHSNLKSQCFVQDNWVFAEDQHIFPVSPSPALIREMLTKQEVILEQQTLILRLLQTGQQNGAEYAIEEGLLPLKDQQGLQSLETDLQGADFKVKLINHLSLIGGCDVKDAVWRLMRRTISNALAKNMNWRGVNRKISLASLQLREVLIAVVRKNPLTSRASESDVESVMKKWLQLAAYREGGRRRRDRSVAAPVP
ncbi:uncharacterized protein LOC121577900 isoform X2 [Coregonus clupeaformis]|uniref:uncharacterized protein LOC121577900 isoform X2 n=1 Tax=Coregonus clupeaformis TaxID=59861 RepID=UPI001BE04B88|nr:uncharacterized protein LOC121577900 isoform X2 [Coregonus clupeaformis]